MKDSLDYREIGRRVKELRVKRHLTQEKLGEGVGISTAFVGHIERGEKKASLETISRLTACLGTTMDYIVLGVIGGCNQLSCPLYLDIQAVLDQYGKEQILSPRLSKSE